MKFMVYKPRGTHTQLVKVKGADPEEFILLTSSPDGSKIERMSRAFSADDFRADMTERGMPTSEIDGHRPCASKSALGRNSPLLPASEDHGHHARAAASVYHCDNPQRFLLRRVGNQIFAHQNEAQGS